MSFYEEMLMRRETSEKQQLDKEAQASQLQEEELKKEALEMERKIKEELSLKKELKEKQRKAEAGQSITVEFDILFSIQTEEEDEEEIRVSFLKLPEAPIQLGDYSSIYLTCVGDERRHPMVVKHLSFSSQKMQIQKKLLDIYEEIDLLRQLQHQNIACIYGASLQKQFELFIAMEYVQGVTLESILMTVGSMKAALAVSLMKQLLAGLAFLHSKSCIHKDVSLRNILISNKRIKLINYSYRSKVSELSKLQNSEREQFWVAPEILEKSTRAISSYLLLNFIVKLMCGIPLLYSLRCYLAWK